MSALEGAARATLVGVATGTPDGGVSIIRLSGPDAARIAALQRDYAQLASEMALHRANAQAAATAAA